MSDKCSMTVYCRTRDAEAMLQAVQDTLGKPCYSDSGQVGVIAMVFDEVDWGGSISNRDHGDIPVGFPCYGHHGSSLGSYGRGEFATDGMVMRYEELSENGVHEHIIGFDALSGEPIEADIERVRSYLAHWRKVFELVHGRPFGPIKP